MFRTANEYNNSFKKEKNKSSNIDVIEQKTLYSKKNTGQKNYCSQKQKFK